MKNRKSKQIEWVLLTFLSFIKLMFDWKIEKKTSDINIQVAKTYFRNNRCT